VLDRARSERRMWLLPTPTSWVGTLTALLVVRMVAATVSPIADCDETFNYWEPLHYILHHTGLQTWE
jgi:alpha-1,2-mannosyltransferase